MGAVEGGADGEPLAKVGGLGGELVVAEALVRRLELADAARAVAELLEAAAFAEPEDLFEGAEVLSLA